MKPTVEKIGVQRDAIVAKVTKIVEAAAASGVNVICFQEAWSEFFLTQNSSFFLFTIFGVSKK